MSDTMHSERITIRVDPALAAELRALARRRGRSESDLVREALRRHVRAGRRKQTCYDLALHLGVVGSAKGLPGDLSTDPKHMEGFGQ